MYQALYRKYRPKVFADVVGQEHVTRTLRNEIRTGRTSHAYLFTGSRGTGKTTCAKIFAKAVNCEHPVDGDPCNECEICKGIDNGSVLDVVEIDAASNNGVDSIRDIRDEANFTPASGKYRVYIIDEVHMLSIGAFNALLKTLEEPPEHVKFILATTEVHKLPATILSRCQRFDFHRISPENIASRVQYVAEQEHLDVTPGAADLIARLADGALRDALSILDQCMGHGTQIDESVVGEVVGLAGKQHLFSLADAILNQDSATALDLINTLHNQSCDMERLCNELINHFRNLMVCKAVSNPQDLIVCSPQELQDYRNSAEQCSMSEIMNVLHVLGETLGFIRKGLHRRADMEMAVIRLCSGEVVQTEIKTSAPAPKRQRPQRAQKPSEPQPAPEQNKPAEKPQEKSAAEPRKPEKTEKPTPAPASSSDILSEETLQEIIGIASQENPSIQILRGSGNRGTVHGQQLLFAPASEVRYEALGNMKGLQGIMGNAAEQVLGKRLEFHLISPEDYTARFETSSATGSEIKKENKGEDSLKTFLHRAQQLGIPVDVEE